ncbi:MAG TPA: FHA domain-containing protein [Vicinamibacteria bacterium]|nr:FHA domain-containing protein [Vicinamibacteria bacterium]
MASLRLMPVSGPPIEVVKDQSMVGRDPSCEIVVTDGSVSRRHARLEKRGGAWWVVDQGSANGTYLNSLRVAEQALKHHQELRFGALAFRVDLVEDPEATVATPVLADDSATVMAPSMPPPAPPAAPAPPPLPPPPAPKAAPPPLPPPAAAPAPPSPPSAAAAKGRFRPGAPSAPVPQMPAGAPPAKKGRSPLFWITAGCCGCLLLGVVLALVIGGGVYMSTKGAADATHAWLGEIRQGERPDAGMTEACRSRLSPDELQAIQNAIARSKDATFYQRSLDNDRATLRGVLTGGGSPKPIVVKLIKEGGTWKVDDVTLGTE